MFFLANRERRAGFARMQARRVYEYLVAALDRSPALALLGPRQVGKTTLALELGKTRPSIYLDLEDVSDRAKLEDARAYLSGHSDKLVILDEVHRAPEIFQTLRGLIDVGRRQGRGTGQFLLLGSASIDLLNQSGESLAGRISYSELAPFDILECGADHVADLWLRGGFPPSLLAADPQASFEWREDFVRTYLERDVPQLGPRIPAETLRRFWTMLAHTQCGLLNASALAEGLGVDAKTVARYLDLLVDLLLVRRLPAWHQNVGKRLVKSPKVLIRDSGLVHTLLRIRDFEQLLGHPVVGASWEAFVIETLIRVSPRGTDAHFYRTSSGHEIDLVLTLPSGALWVIEVKRSTAPKIERGFYVACADLKPAKRFVVYPGQERYQKEDQIIVTSVFDLARELAVSCK